MRFIFENREAGQNLAEQPRLGKERRSFFPILSLRRLRLAAAGQILSLGTALILLSLAVPDAGAQSQPVHTRAPDKDIATSGLGLSNKNPRGIWVDEGKQVMLVLDARYKKIFTYCLDTGRRLDNHHNDRVEPIDKDFETEAKKAAVNEDDFFLFNSSDPIVVDDNSSEELKDRYRGATTAAKSKRLYPYQGNSNLLLPNPYGIWSDGTNLWVSNFGQKDPDTKNFDGPRAIKPQIYAYTITWTNSPIDSTKEYAKGTRDSTKDFNPQTLITAGNGRPHGIWVHDGIMWVADNGADKIFAYNWPSKTHNPSKDITLTHKDAYAQGVWSDGTTLWVANIEGIEDDDKQIIYAYDISLQIRDPRKDFTALSAAGNDRPRGIWSNGTIMWVADQADNKIYAYNLPVPPNLALDFNTLKDAGNTKPKGIWSDGKTMWVADATIMNMESKAKLYAYDFFTKERLLDKEFNTLIAAGNAHPTGIWSDGTTMWVADYIADKIYAYKMSDKSRDEDKDFDTLKAAGNNHPIGLWSDGTTMWIADTEDDKVYAYKMSDKARFSEVIDGETVYSKDIDVNALIGNVYPQGIWSDGTTMWVADWRGTNRNSTIYAFTLPVVDNGRTTVTKASRVEAKDLNVLALANKKAFGLWSDETTMWVADEDPVNSKIYAYRLSDAASLGELKITGHIPSPEYEDFNVDLKINDEPKKPPFNSGITRYTASVPYATASLTIAPTPLRTGDVASILPVDTDTTDTENGHQVNLAVGQNIISITVANADTNITSLPRTRTYTVVVTREFFTYNDPSKDVLVSTNSIIQGIWANETTLWAADSETTYTNIVTVGETNQTNLYKKILAYNRATKQRDAGKDINLIPDNFDPIGIWSNGTIMWIADSDDDKLYGYGLTSRARLNSTNDFTLVDANANPQWIWSDGVTMWVSDNATITNIVNEQMNEQTNTYQKIYAYNMSDKKRNRNKENSLKLKNLGFKSNSGKEFGHFTGMWSDGATLWIADKEDDKIYAFKRNKEEIDCPDATEDFNTLAAVDNTDPAAIFSDGSTMWVVDKTAKKIFAYNQPLSANNKLKRLELNNVYSESTSMLIEEVFSSVTNNYSAYVVYTDLSTTVTAIAQDPDAGVSIQPKDADLATPGHQINLPAEATTEIVITVTAENAAVKKYTVNVARKSGGRTPIRDFGLEGDRANAIGIWGNEETIWVTDGGSKQIYAYDRDNGTHDTSKDFTHTGTQSPRSIWGDGTTIWVVNDDDGNVSNRKLYAYNMWTNNVQGNPSWDGSRVPSKDIPLGASNRDPKGIWGNETTMWVADTTDDKLYAYKLELGAEETENDRHDSNKDFGTLIAATNESPWGIWSTNDVMWILDWEDNKIYAYNSTTKERILVRNVGNRDINGLEGSSGGSRGIWSDNTTMWVANGRNLYAYNLPQPGATANSGPSEDFALSDLRLSGIELSPVFSPDNLYYKVIVNHDVASTTVTATPNDSGAVVEILWSSDRSATARTANRGRQVALSEGYNFIAVDVTAENGDMQSYVVWVTKAEAPPVSGGPLPVLQAQAVSGNNSTALASSSAGNETMQSRLIFAEPLQNGGVRFVFLVTAEEFKIETTPDLLSGEWRALADDKVQMVREDNGDGQDRLTVILPRAEGEQRFLRLTPQR